MADAAGCPGLDVTLSELIAIGRREARKCFGNSQLTLRGWVWEDRGVYDCVTYSAPGDPVPPAWLYCAATEHVRLTPAAYAPGEPRPGYIRSADGPFHVAVDPGSPAAGVLEPNQWVEVVGQFDDPITELCELVGDPNFRDQCLSTFVVREARLIDAPYSPSLNDSARLPVEGFATVVADTLSVRQAPGVNADPVLIGCVGYPADTCPPLVVGTKVPSLQRPRAWLTSLYLFNGPVMADGYEWYLAAVVSDSGSPVGIGWVAAGDADDSWLIADNPECPEPPIELSEVTYQALGPFERIACLGGQHLTLRGWAPEIPPLDDECGELPGGCYYSLQPITPGYVGDPPDLELKPASGVQMPARGQWLEVIGAFDHPSAASCGTSGDPLADQAARLPCRVQFVVISARPIDQ